MKRKSAKSKEPKMVRPLVLVADDSAVVRKIIELCLAGSDIDVVGAAGGPEAVEKLKSTIPNLVLVDAVMPEPDGYALCERIKKGEFGDPVPVVLLADLVEPIDGLRAASCGADGHMAKPFEAQTLQLMVYDQLGIGGAPVDAPAPSIVSPALQESSRRFAGAARQDSSARLEEGGAPSQGIDGLDLDAVARRVVSLLSDKVVREIAWEVVPELSEVLIKERLQQSR